MRFLDNVIDVNNYPMEEITALAHGNRKIGLGVMGFADLLIRLGIPYNSDEGLSLAHEVMKFIQERSHAASAELARLRGVFPNYQKSVFAQTGERLRNATVTTIAPTGTLSIIAGCSSGIEPLFAIVFTRRILDNQQMLEIHPYFEQVARQRNFYSKWLMEEISRSKSLAEVEDLPLDVRRVFVTAYDADPEWHIRMQAEFQAFTDNAVSKTVNFRHEATLEDIRTVYTLAYKLGCKGVTVYRDGSRDDQVLSTGKAKEAPSSLGLPEPTTFVPAASTISPRDRPTLTRGSTEKVATGCGKLFITINEDEQGLCEVFTTIGKSGGCTSSQSEAIARMISTALRSGIAPQVISEQLKGIRCPMPSWDRGSVTLSCADAIGKSIERYLSINGKNGNNGNGHATAYVHTEPKVQSLPSSDHNGVASAGYNPECPECGTMLELSEGCVVCRSCGYSRCA